MQGGPADGALPSLVPRARCGSISAMIAAVPAVAFDAVSKRYGTAAAKAVDAVTLNIAAGEFVAVVGASGSGKSTLLRFVNRLLDPDQGEVRIHGENTLSMDKIALRRRIGYVFQSGGLFPHLSVAANIGITPRLAGGDPAAIAARVDDLLDLVRLDRDYRDHLPEHLSGGQRQRVGVARALAARPDIVLMDEPFGALDPLTRDALGSDYLALHRRLELTTVMITHDMAEAVLLADRIAVMREGRLVAVGTARELAASSDAGVLALLRTPRRQAARLQDLMPPLPGEAS